MPIPTMSTGDVITATYLNAIKTTVDGKPDMPAEFVPKFDGWDELRGIMRREGWPVLNVDPFVINQTDTPSTGVIYAQQIPCLPNKDITAIGVSQSSAGVTVTTALLGLWTPDGQTKLDESENSAAAFTSTNNVKEFTGISFNTGIYHTLWALILFVASTVPTLRGLTIQNELANYNKSGATLNVLQFATGGQTALPTGALDFSTGWSTSSIQPVLIGR